MDNKVDITVIVVNYNSGGLLLRCIDNVLASTIPVKVVIVDNASNDNSLFFLRLHHGNDPRLRVIENMANIGFSKANNLALKCVATNYVLLLNPDNLIARDTLEGLYKIMEEQPDVGMSGCLVLNPDGSEQRGCRRREPSLWNGLVDMFGLGKLMASAGKNGAYDLRSDKLPDQPVEVEAISGSFMFVRASAFRKTGYMDSGYFLHCEDLDWCKQFREKHYKILFVPKLKAVHYQGACSEHTPLRVSWHKHFGMARYYWKYATSILDTLLALIVIPGIWLHFMAISFKDVVFKRRDGTNSDRTEFPGGFEEILRKNKVGIKTGKQEKEVLVTGASSLVGKYLLPRLLNSGYRVVAVTRKAYGQPSHSNLQWLECDIGGPVNQSDFFEARNIIHLAPLWLLPNYLSQISLGKVSRVIAFSSTSIFTKRESNSLKERNVASSLEFAEKLCGDIADEKGFCLTLFRPTLIYGSGQDKNISAIARTIGRFGFFPIIGKGVGKRQPVHADDLAKACLQALTNEATFSKAYDLSGGEVMSYRAMVSRVFDSLGRAPRIVGVPVIVFKTILSIIRAIPGFRYLTPEMIDRINIDMQFEHCNATKEFGYRPRKFLSK
ncbi:MAG TPA: glycosyltransferase [Gammaproteobacteria bacterium]|nr:glycosyltransferase [Gammaproteobacteria bacterium]